MPSDSMMIESSVHQDSARGGARERLAAMGVPWPAEKFN
jgi:hypothetical protein